MFKINIKLLIIFAYGANIICAEYGTDKISYKGIFDTSIYKQDEATNLENATLRELLKSKKIAMIEEHFGRKILESKEYKECLQGKPIDWVGACKDLGKALIGGFVAYHGSFKTSIAFGEAAEKFLPSEDSVDAEKIKELAKQIEDLQQVQKKLVKGIDDEIISALEHEFILKRRFISQNLQGEIETMLIRVRDEEESLSEKMDYIRNALDLPMTHKKLDLEQSLERFYNSSHFSNFDEKLRDDLLRIIYKICIDSNTDDDSSTTLRTTCLFHGPPGAGKTSTVPELADILGGLPHFAITIHHDSELTSDSVTGNRGWQPRIGWLAQALMAKAPDNKRYTNGFLVLNDFDNMLFHSDGSPNHTGISFLCEHLDTNMKEIFSNYFNANMLVKRLNIVVTSNTSLPKDTIDLLESSLSNDKSISFSLKNPFSRLISRVDVVFFMGFSENKISDFLSKFMDELFLKHNFSPNTDGIDKLKTDLFQEALRIQKGLCSEDTIELRLLKRQLENLVIQKKMATLTQKYKKTIELNTNEKT